MTRLLGVLALCSLALTALAACDTYDRPAPLPVRASPVPTPDPKGPVKIGVLHATTGPYAPLGLAGNEGVRVALGYTEPVTIGGRKVQPIFEDTEGKPDVALQRLRKLVEQDKVAVVIGPTSNVEFEAVRSYAAAHRVPLLLTFPQAGRFTQAEANPYVFRVNGTPQAHRAAGWYAARRAGYQQAAVVASDYADGREAAAEFEAGFVAGGGSVAGQVLVPLGAPHAAPYLAEARRLGRQAGLLAAPMLVGQVAAELVNASDAPASIVSAAATVPSEAPPRAPVAEGTLNYAVWRPGIDTPENRVFEQGMRSLARVEPTLHHLHGYLAGQVVLAALRATGAATDDPVLLRSALERVDFMGPGGRFRFDARRQAIVTVHIWPGERARGGATAAIPDVTQDWRVPD